MPAVSTCTRASAVSTRVRTVRTSATASGTESPSNQQQPIIRPLERRARMPERTGGRGQRRAALRSDCRRLGGGTSTANEGRPHWLSRAADDGLRLACQVGLVESESVRGHHCPVGDHLVARRHTNEIPATTRSTGTRRSTPSRTTTAVGATSEPADRARAWSGISWNDPIAMFETRIPRNSASFHDPKAIVSTPNRRRIPFGTVSVLARTMLA